MQQTQQNDSEPSRSSPQESEAPGTDSEADNHNNADNDSKSKNGIHLNGAASNKLESNDLAEPTKTDDLVNNSNTSPAVAAAAPVTTTVAVPPAQQNPPLQQNSQNPPAIQPLMNVNMPMQPQGGPPAQIQTQFNTPPPFGFGMPPPNYMYPPNPWSMPWQPMPQQMGNDKSRIIDPQVSSIHE